MSEASSGFKVGDRVRTTSGIMGTIVEPPRYYETAEGDPFTEWAVVVEEDVDPQLTLTCIERGLSPGSRHLVVLDQLIPISD